MSPARNRRCARRRLRSLVSRRRKRETSSSPTSALMEVPTTPRDRESPRSQSVALLTSWRKRETSFANSRAIRRPLVALPPARLELFSTSGATTSGRQVVLLVGMAPPALPRTKFRLRPRTKAALYLRLLTNLTLTTRALSNKATATDSPATQNPFSLHGHTSFGLLDR